MMVIDIDTSRLKPSLCVTNRDDCFVDCRRSVYRVMHCLDMHVSTDLTKHFSTKFVCMCNLKIKIMFEFLLFLNTLFTFI